MEFLRMILEFLQPYGTHSYFIIFSILILCAVGLPMPEDIILIAAGILASQRITSIEVTMVVVLIGVVGGDSAVFWAGRLFGPRLRKTLLFRWIFNEAREKKVTEGFYKYGDKLIFLARFMPGVRTLVFSTAGIYNVPYWKLLLFDGTAALISVPFWVWVGYMFGSNLETVETYVKTAKFSILGVFVVLAIFIVLYFWKKKNLKNQK